MKKFNFLTLLMFYGVSLSTAYSSSNLHDSCRYSLFSTRERNIVDDVEYRKNIYYVAAKWSEGENTRKAVSVYMPLDEQSDRYANRIQRLTRSCVQIGRPFVELNNSDYPIKRINYRNLPNSNKVLIYKDFYGNQETGEESHIEFIINKNVVDSSRLVRDRASRRSMKNINSFQKFYMTDYVGNSVRRRHFLGLLNYFVRDNTKPTRVVKSFLDDRYDDVFINYYFNNNDL